MLKSRSVGTALRGADKDGSLRESPGKRFRRPCVIKGARTDMAAIYAIFHL